jgi:hypothetical protein
MIETIIAFLATNKAAIGAIVSILEAIVVLINLWRKFNNSGGEVESMSASPSSVFKGFLWVINPVNVFRKPL